MSSQLAVSQWGIVGHHEAVSRLQADATSGTPAHAYLFTGPEEVGRTTTALAFARALNCLRTPAERPCGDCESCRRISLDWQHQSHPDVTVADVEWQQRMFGGTGNVRQQFSIEAIRWLRQNIGTRPVFGRWKIQIVDDADRFSDVAPDAYLKTLEEPPSYAVIILIATSPDTVSETIRSRCRLIQFGFVSADEITSALETQGVEVEEAKRLARIARGRVATAFSLAQDPKALSKRTERLNEAYEHITSKLERLRIPGTVAKNHTRNRDRTYSLLDTYTGIWRDTILIRSGLTTHLTYPEFQSSLEEFIQDIETRELYRALKATQRCMEDLDSNFQARIALQAMVMHWPT